MVFLDANTLIYYLDESAKKYLSTINLLQKLVDEQEQIVTSHHVLEEVLFVVSKIQPDIDLIKVVKRIGELPGIILVEPSPHIAFAKRYVTLRSKLHLGINDALLLQLMIDANIPTLFSYDEQLANKAKQLGIERIV